MFAIDWVRRPWTLLQQHPVAFPAAVSGASVALGLFYQLVYFRPFGIPIAQFSSMEDFAVVGTQSLFLFPLAAVIIVAALALVICLVVRPLLAAVRLAVHILSLLAQIFLLAVVGTFLYVAHVTSVVLVWVVRQPAIVVQWLGMRIVGSTRGLAGDAPPGAIGCYRDQVTSLAERHGKRVGALAGVLRGVDGRAAKWGTWLREINRWDEVNKHLSSDRATRSFLLLAALLSLLATWASANAVSSRVLKEHALAPPAPAPAPAGLAAEQAVRPVAALAGELFTGVAEVYFDLLQPYALVEVGLERDTETRTAAVQLGRTSHYFLFLHLDGDDAGEVVVVRQEDVREVIAIGNGNRNGAGPGTTDPDLVEQDNGKPVQPLVDSRVSLEVVNRLQLTPGPVAAGARERVVAILMFDVDADANAWFSDAGYRDCEREGSAAICVATGSTGYGSPYRQSLTDILKVAHFCGSVEEQTRLRIVGYASSSNAKTFFRGVDAQTVVRGGQAGEDFEACRAVSDDDSTAFNRCVARDRAEGVARMLGRLLEELRWGGDVEDERRVTIVPESAELASGVRTTFPDVDLASGTYNRDVGRLNRRVDLILAETPSCRFVDEV